ncbi:DUF1531-domain-containing protein [Biscogniauxia marginata]|nr:DUF1531-domain-containing protein [Biscogniauxia marginata]
MSEIFELFTHLGESVSNLAKLVSSRFTNNVGESFNSMTTQQWIRLIVVVGGYMLLRPYVIKMGANHQVKQLEKQHAEDEREAQAQLSPNNLRGKIDIPEDSDEEGEGEGEKASTSASDWGKKARKRQRNMIKQLLEVEEKRLQELQEDEEDKDIEKYLVG